MLLTFEQNYFTAREDGKQILHHSAQLLWEAPTEQPNIKHLLKKKESLLSPHFDCILLFQSRHSTITAVKLQVQGSFVQGLCTKFKI